MSKPVPALNLAVGYPTALLAIALNTTAVSTEAKAVSTAAQNASAFLDQSQALFGPKWEAISRLMAVANEQTPFCAVAADPMAVWITEKFVRLLPDSASMPEFCVDPDGAISLDWIESRKKLFSLSVSGNSRLAYAWVDGTESGRGVANFDIRRIPDDVIKGIAKIA